MTDSTTLPPLLLVDDDPGVLELLREWTSDAGYPVQVCDGGMKALEILDGWNSGIVVADLNMPGMGGLSLCRSLRAQARTWSPYFLVLTADDDPKLVQDVFQNGADDFVRKPVSRTELLGRLQAATRLSRLADDLRDRSDVELERRIHQASLSELKEVVSTLAHDLRTPIGALRTTAEMLVWKADTLPPDVARGLDRMVALAIHLSETVTDVADAFVCDDLDPLRESWTSFDLVAECVRTCELVRPKLGSRVSLVVPEARQSLMVRGNPPGIRRLVMNILSNALRATTSGAVRLSVAVDDDPEFVVVSIDDTGGGIPVELLPHLGEPLMLSSGSTVRKRSVHGAGLGLAICRRIVAHHGGRILIATTPRVGTAVRIRIRRNLSEPSLEIDHCPLDTEIRG